MRDVHNKMVRVLRGFWQTEVRERDSTGWRKGIMGGAEEVRRRESFSPSLPSRSRQTQNGSPRAYSAPLTMGSNPTVNS